MPVAGLSQRVATFARRYAEATEVPLEKLDAAARAEVVAQTAAAFDLSLDDARAAYATLSGFDASAARDNVGTSALDARLSKGPPKAPADDHPLRYATIMAGLEEPLSDNARPGFEARWSQLDAARDALAAKLEELPPDAPARRALAGREAEVLVEMQSMSKTLSGQLGDKKAADGQRRIEATYDLVQAFIDEGRPMSIGRMRKLNEKLRPEAPDAAVGPGRFRQPGKSKETAFLRGCCPHRFTSEAVHQFLFSYRDAEASGMHPIELAARTYQRFVSIHPFSDGNGRTARALMDWVLMKNGFPPAALEDAKVIGYDAATGTVATGMADKAVEQVTAAIERELGRRTTLVEARGSGLSSG
jgi:prophage maintenance system killer protein